MQIDKSCYRFDTCNRQPKVIMLITFKSRSSPDLLMFQEHAQRLLELLHKSPTRGVITAAEAGDALAVLEKAVADNQSAPQQVAEPNATEQDEGEAAEQKKSRQVGFSARAYPLLQMLRAAKAHGDDIMWGV